LDGIAPTIVTVREELHVAPVDVGKLSIAHAISKAPAQGAYASANQLSPNVAEGIFRIAEDTD
jgi:hypothetical protein